MFLTLCVFEPPPLTGLVATYTVHIRLVGKLVVNFPLFVLIELFWLCITAKALRANIYRKSAFLKDGQFQPNFHVQ